MATRKKTKKRRTKSKKIARHATRKSLPSRSRARRSPKKKAAKKKTARRKKTAVAESFPSRRPRVASGRQAGDVQGLSTVRGADSQSVDELVEEGNAFEADVVSGVEAAGKQEGREVRTREVPEDDVPGEYLDEQ